MRDFKNTLVFLAVVLMSSCVGDDQGGQPSSPTPIGDELMRRTGSWSDCSAGLHLYRQGMEIQSQCFGPSGYVYESRATLTAEADVTLDTHLAAADLENMMTVNHLGLCGSSDITATVTLWIDGQEIQFADYCPTQGVLSVYEYVDAIWSELAACGEEPAELLAEIEPGCGLP